jgi:hypothetical protein
MKASETNRPVFTTLTLLPLPLLLPFWVFIADCSALKNIGSRNAAWDSQDRQGQSATPTAVVLQCIQLNSRA